MMSRLRTSAISGIEACAVDVEVQCKNGQNKFTIIGLGDSAVKEAKDRVTAAIKQSGFQVPDIILVNLAPADLKKEGASFDLAIATGVLIASNQLVCQNLSSTCVYGELSLDGHLKPVRGIVALVVSALQSGMTRAVVPVLNFREANLVSGIEVIPVDSLSSFVHYLKEGEFSEVPEVSRIPESRDSESTIEDVWGQERAKRAMLIASAGGHNMLMIGPPGCGKSMLAGRFAGLLPPLTQRECLEVVKIHSVAGLPIKKYLSGIRPYRSPHHVVSDVGLIGGGAYPRPGEISLAHHGVLFLDEFPEYRRSAIEALRAPLESGEVRITRAKASHSFPARFQLLAAMNPCPCGRLGVRNSTCLCSRPSIQAYLKKLSEPILDRIDLHVELDAVPVSSMTGAGNIAAENTVQSGMPVNYRDKIIWARAKQAEGHGNLNAHIEAKLILKSKRVQDSAFRLLESAIKGAGISARAFVRVLRVSLTIADFEQSELVHEEHVAEALSFRRLDRLRKFCE